MDSKSFAMETFLFGQIYNLFFYGFCILGLRFPCFKIIKERKGEKKKLHCFCQPSGESVKQPKARIWGLRDCNSQGAKLGVDRNCNRAPNFERGVQAYKDKSHKTCLEIIMTGAAEMKLPNA